MKQTQELRVPCASTEKRNKKLNSHKNMTGKKQFRKYKIFNYIISPAEHYISLCSFVCFAVKAESFSVSQKKFKRDSAAIRSQMFSCERRAKVINRKLQISEVSLYCIARLRPFVS